MSLSKSELRATLVVSLIFSMRLLGLFILLPVFSLYASEYNHSSAFLAGIAIGSYSLAQAIMQIPMGYLSDKFGRKKIVIFGLILFSTGSLICFYANQINILILGRVIQGLGAISSVGIATLSENTSEENRASAFTIMGIAVGGSFFIGFLAGPYFTSLYSFKSLFILLLTFGIIATFITFLYYPNDLKQSKKVSKISFKYNNKLVQIYLGSFFLSLILSIMLYVFPLIWRDLGTLNEDLFSTYLKIFLPAAIIVYPSIRFFEKIKKVNIAINLGWFFLIVAFLAYILLPSNIYTFYSLGILFFLGSSVFQSLLPSLLSLNVSSDLRATGNGPFYIMNFLGHAVGSIFAGAIYMKDFYFGFDKNFLICIICILLIALWISVGLPKYSIKENSQ
ncbi:MAG: MFS transporter [Deltaproteobacteria bacterium TMED126]|mgnify:FL=1|nr:MFS transporter [Candidatus Dadabacteria bacterium]NSW97419.1 MFS transporter [Deltaproteobacteria bacterium TMED126]|tara:strand:+ start:3743 stop:4921 length:1179 start_codon:yes stop_codon:yes gene_type:complete